jgi:hypothetical protein
MKASYCNNIILRSITIAEATECSHETEEGQVGKNFVQVGYTLFDAECVNQRIMGIFSLAFFIYQNTSTNID